MNVLKRLAMVILSLFFVSACAGAKVKNFEKYDLDDQLEPVEQILKYNMMGWEKVDNQSFVLQTSPSQYYLIVLIHPSNRLPFTESISITNTGDMVKPGYDRVTVYDSTGNDTYTIYKIYKLKDREQINSIEEQLTGK